MKQEKKRSSKNLKINTRIAITAVLAIVIPIIIIATCSTVLITTAGSYFNFSTVTTNSYSTINQIQWSQTLTGITDELMGDDSKEVKLDKIKSIALSLENIGSSIYIERDGTEFYSTGSVKQVLDKADSIIKVPTDENVNYFGDNGLVIVNHAQGNDGKYMVIIVNDDYTVNDASHRISAKDFTKLLLGRTGILVLIIVLLFVIAIAIISSITSGTIVKPIKKIAHGADEIARGNLDYEIDYKSTNELGQTVDSFNEMRLRLKNSIERQNKAEEERKELIAGIAHDVRTPLTSAKGYAEGLLDGIADTPEKQTLYLQTICSSINDTEKILDDLLAISKFQLKGYRLNKEDISIREFVEDGAREIKTILDSRNFNFGILINCDADTLVSIDPDAFSRVISNIISNSIKYARDDVQGRVDITLSEYDRSVILEISDNGIGVDKKSLPKIFDAMYRADPARTKVSQGSGLGLSVCKQIVELHGGLIWASSRENQGLSIFISLPKKEVLE
ncbi:MAG: ATP-binding protein [Eubacterium sp.]